MSHRYHHTVVAFSFLSIFTGCITRQGSVDVTATLDGVPLAAFEVVAVRYDVDGLLDSLTQARPLPRPDFSSLEAEMAEFRRQDPSSMDAVYADWSATRESVGRLADSLNRMSRSAPGYAAEYSRFRAAYESLARTEATLEAQTRQQYGPERDLATRAGAAADTLRRWEKEAFRELATPVDSTGTVFGETDGLGHVRLALSKGKWWLVARRPHPDNPFLEYAWNVPVVSSHLVPVVAPISSHNVTLRWRR